MFRAEQLIGALEYQYKFGADFLFVVEIGFSFLLVLVFIEFCCLRAWPGTLLNLFYCPRYDDVDVVAIVIKDALMFQLWFLLSRFLALIFFRYFRYMFVGELLMISR
jgi:hypothetical protein